MPPLPASDCPVDTFKELFEGNRALFSGVAAEKRWDWSLRHPVVRISFADGMLRSRAGLDRRIQSNLRRSRAALAPSCSALCGHTDADIDRVFAAELPGLDREQIRRWYNGYHWLGEGVYNPFDMLCLFRNRTFQPYWFETGTPTILVRLLAERQFHLPRLQALQTSLALLSSFDVDRITPEALLFQTGCLTIHDVRQPVPGKWMCTLVYPNREVEASLNEALLQEYGVPGDAASQTQERLSGVLRRGALGEMESLMRALFASIPSDWYRRSPLAGFEGLCKRLLQPFRRARPGCAGRRRHQPRSCGHGGAACRAGLSFRVQGAQAAARRIFESALAAELAELLAALKQRAAQAASLQGRPTSDPPRTHLGPAPRECS